MKTVCGILAFASFLSLSSLQAQPSPQDKPDQWVLSFLDIETTGLKPGYDEIVNVGIILSDLEGREISRTLLYIMPDHPERASKEAIAINGFDVDRWKSLHALSVRAAVDSITSFYRLHAAGKQVLMVAYNSQFDAAFMDHLFNDAGKDIRQVHHYYVLDVPSMAWILGFRNLYGDDVARTLGIAGTSKDPVEHTGLGCADFNLRVYRKLLSLAPKPK